MSLDSSGEHCDTRKATAVRLHPFPFAQSSTECNEPYPAWMCTWLTLLGAVLLGSSSTEQPNVTARGTWEKVQRVRSGCWSKHSLVTRIPGKNASREFKQAKAKRWLSPGYIWKFLIPLESALVGIMPSIPGCTHLQSNLKRTVAINATNNEYNQDLIALHLFNTGAHY